MEIAEGDEPAEQEDNSLGRLLALSDGVFAIAMTLLALDLRVPDLGEGATEAQLEAALYGALPNIFTFLVSFYVVASYWVGHHRLMRSVATWHPRLLTTTLPLLLVVAALPFPSSLLAEYAHVPISLGVYGAVNAVASMLLLVLRHHVRALRLAPEPTDRDAERRSTWELWGNLIVFLLCVPAGYVLGENGLWALSLLFVSGRLPALWLWWRRRSARSGTTT